MNLSTNISCMNLPLLFFFVFVLGLNSKAQNTIYTDVLVVGGGVGGTAAGIQSARLGAKTIIVEPTTWLGGMISAAGVSATDGNHRLPSGLWKEFRDRVHKVYGGPAAVATGWVSDTQFEPHVADSIFKAMASNEKALTLLFHHSFTSLKKTGTKITDVQFTDHKTGKTINVKAKIVIDATELGDVMKAAGVPYDLGMEAGSITGEKVGVDETNAIVQDLTYVAILKDFNDGGDHSIPKPVNYTPEEFDGACTDYYKDTARRQPTVDGKKMLDYGRLPNNKYMLNWPIYGNDTYLNIVEMDDSQRAKALLKAKEQTLRFVYFIQNQLGFKNLGLAKDEFPTPDQLALMPYHREGRRVKGLVRMTMRHIAEPFTYGDALYRTGISVGDYPIDHHHKKNPAAPQHLDFYPIPSYNIPLGALIPQTIDNLVIAEKGISVSNIANGTTRLQPCVLLTGQAAGTVAAMSARQNLAPKKIPVRSVQSALLKAKAYIMPYMDVMPDNQHWEAVQKLGATGILKGTGIPDKWANQTWFYPDSTVDAVSLAADLNNFQKGSYSFAAGSVTINEAAGVLIAFDKFILQAYRLKKIPHRSYMENLLRVNWQRWGLKNFVPGRQITRLELAVLFHKMTDVFSMKAVNHRGAFVN